jgi:hypothetical protein
MGRVATARSWRQRQRPRGARAAPAAARRRHAAPRTVLYRTVLRYTIRYRTVYHAVQLASPYGRHP